MQLATRTVGNGSRTAALVHGASMNGDAWRDFLPYVLEHDFTVILVDQRGHGDSPRAERYRMSRRGPLPYGSAIAAGALIALFRG